MKNNIINYKNTQSLLPSLSFIKKTITPHCLRFCTLLLFISFWGMEEVMGQTNPGNVFDLSTGSWTLTGWNPSVTSSLYPTNGSTGLNTTSGVSSSATTSNMRFWKHGTSDPLISNLPSADYTGNYASASGTIYGNGTSGIGFNNTGGVGIGSVVLSVNTTGRQNIQISWTGRTIATGARTYGIRLMYRVGTTGNFTDANTTSSNVFYPAASATGATVMPTVTLPTNANNAGTVQILWFYYNEATTTSGTRPTLGLDEITVSSSSISSVNTPPVLSAANTATVDGSFDVTFTDDQTWRNAITSVKYGSTILIASTDYNITSGKITLIPSGTVNGVLRTVGTSTLTVIANGYSDATVSQSIGAGAANKLAITTQPAAPAINGGAFATQPVIAIQDQYGNATTSTATVSATVGAGSWTIGGTTAVAGVSGTATFTNLTATSAAAVTGATITFSSGALTSVTSSTFNIVAPPPANDLCNNATTLTNGVSTSGTTISATYSSLASEPYTANSDVWYIYTAVASGTVTVQSTNSSTIDYDLFAYSSNCPTLATGIGSTPTSSTSSETMTFSATSGTSYYIRVVNSTNTSGSAFTISVSQAIASPTLAASSNITCSGFNTNWSSVNSATGYKLDVATNSFPSSSNTQGFSSGTTAPTGWVFTAIGGTYTTSGNYGLASPSLQMDATNDRVQTISYSGVATQMSFWYKGQSATGSSLLVEGYNGTSWVTIQNITSLASTGTTVTYNSASNPILPSNLNQFRFTYTRSSGNLSFDDVTVNLDNSNYISGFQDLSVSSTTKSVTGLTPNTKYYYRVRSTDGINTSASSNIDSVTTTVIPSAPTATSPQILCPSATVNSLAATGTSIKWYDASSGGNLLPSSTALTHNMHYYATQTVSGCESSTRTDVTVSLQNVWSGNASNWNNASNWSCGHVPTATENVLINTGSPALDINYEVPSNYTLTISNPGTLTINPGNKLTITGTTDFGNQIVTVAANASNTGAIVLNGGSLQNATNVVLQQWFTGQRAWRMLSNPFTTSITSSSIANKNTGFSVNQSGTGDIVVYNSANDSWSADTTIAANSCYAFFYKGLQSDFNGTPGLSNYSGAGPTASVFSVKGTLNTGSVNIAPSNASPAYTLVGNPFAAPINSIALTGGAAAPYFYYQANAASTDIKVKSGAWIANSGSSNTTTIPMMGLIAYQAQNTLSFPILITDINTSSTAISALFKTTATAAQMNIDLMKNNSLFDRCILREDVDATAQRLDQKDLLKMENVTANIYALTPANDHLAVYTEPSFTQAIPLAISAPIGTYQFNIQNALNSTADWYLIDNYLHQQKLLTNNSSYTFDINNDAASKGSQRFELSKQTWTTSIGTSSNQESIQLLGNLVQDHITLQVDATIQQANYQLVDLRGAVLAQGTLSAGKQEIAMASLASGLYILHIQNDHQRLAYKITKQ